MVNEAAKLLDEGVTDSTDAIDLATVLGTGLAPFRGGLARFADAAGTETIVTKLDELAAKHGPRFEPAPLLRRRRRGQAAERIRGHWAGGRSATAPGARRRCRSGRSLAADGRSDRCRVRVRRRC